MPIFYALRWTYGHKYVAKRWQLYWSFKKRKKVNFEKLGHKVFVNSACDMMATLAFNELSIGIESFSRGVFRNWSNICDVGFLEK